MASKLIIREGLLDRLKRMTGIKTDEALAGAIGVSPSTLSKLNKGGEPTARVLIGIHDAFGLTPGEITTIRPGRVHEQPADDYAEKVPA